ncbi:MAG: glycosyltransferase family 4 protein [Cyanobacteria bacterium J06643_5]
MKYHLAFSYFDDLEVINQKAQAGKCPAHLMLNVARLLDAKIHQPNDNFLLPVDYVYEKIIGSQHTWSLARKVSTEIDDNDVIFCTDESIGIPIAKYCRGKRKGLKIAVFVHNLNRLRGRFALKLFKVRQHIDLFMTANQKQARFLRDYLDLAENQVCQFPYQPTDISFFKPKHSLLKKSRPLIVSGGLEQRDYRTLAQATEALNVDVRVSAASPTQTVNLRTFPQAIPANMSYRYHDWKSLLQLYRDADIVVISLLQNNFQAGLSTLFEALACRKPVIVTRSEGIIQELIDEKAVLGVNPGDYQGLRQAINSLLADSKQSRAIAEKGYQLVLERYNSQIYTKALVEQLRNISSEQFLINV